jgi:hypothetical protein
MPVMPPAPDSGARLRPGDLLVLVCAAAVLLTAVVAASGQRAEQRADVRVLDRLVPPRVQQVPDAGLPTAPAVAPRPTRPQVTPRAQPTAAPTPRTARRRVPVPIATTGPTTARPEPSTPSVPGPRPTTGPTPPKGPPPRPGAANTGVPEGTALRASGPLTVSKNGAVLSGLDVKGCIRVRANDVVIRKSRVRCSDGPVISLGDSYTGLRIEQSTLDGLGTATQSLYAVKGVTMSRNEITRTQDGARVGSSFTFVGNWVHGLVRIGDFHVDALQTLGAQNVVIRGNTFDVYNSAEGQRVNSVFQMGTTQGPALKSILVEDNYMNGGNCTVNMHLEAKVLGGVVFRRNTFGPDSERCTHIGLDRPGVVFDDTNVLASTGRAVSR